MWCSAVQCSAVQCSAVWCSRPGAALPCPAVYGGCTHAVCRVQVQRATRPRRRRISSPTAAASSLQNAATSPSTGLAVAWHGILHSITASLLRCAERQCLPHLHSECCQRYCNTVRMTACDGECRRMGSDSVRHATAVDGSKSQRALRLCRKTFAFVLSLALLNNTYI